MNNQSYIGSCLYIIIFDPNSSGKKRLMDNLDNENDLFFGNNFNDIINTN